MAFKLFLKASFFVFFLSSCFIGEGRGGDLNSQVIVDVRSQFSDSFLRTPGGNPYIRIFGGPRICRVRPYYIENVRAALLDSGVSEEILDDYLFSGDTSEEGGEGEEGGESSSDNERSLDPIFHNVGNNWLEFGLIIQNNTDFVLVITSVRLQGVARCGGRIFTYSGPEIVPGYCFEEGLPVLYIVAPRTQINYFPDSTDPIHNLKLYFSGFEIDDRRNELSQRLQNIANRGNRTQGEASNPTIQGESRAGGACQPHRKDFAIPKYQLEVSLRGYFIGVSEEYSTVDFFKRKSFSTDVIYD